jgi:hypothetical protein
VYAGCEGRISELISNGAKMIRRPNFSLVFLGAILGMLGTAHADTITYDFVTPSGGLSNSTVSGDYLAGSITVDSTGISATPIDLTTGMIQSWHISVLDSTNTVIFSLTSPANFISLTDTSTFESFGSTAPQITSTSIYLPTLTLPDGVTFNLSQFILEKAAGNNPEINWISTISSIGGFTLFSTEVKAVFAVASSVDGGLSFTNSEQLIATVEPTATPVPSTLVMSSILFGMGGVGLVYRRFKKTATAV